MYINPLLPEGEIDVFATSDQNKCSTKGSESWKVIIGAVKHGSDIICLQNEVHF